MKIGVTLTTKDGITQFTKNLELLLNKVPLPIDFKFEIFGVGELALEPKYNTPPLGKYVCIDNMTGKVIEQHLNSFTVKFSKSEVTFPKGYSWSFINEYEYKKIVFDGTFEIAKSIIHSFSDNIEHLSHLNKCIGMGLYVDEERIIGEVFSLTICEDADFNFYFKNEIINKCDKICWWEHVVTGEKIKIHIEKNKE